jgi:ribosomal protein S8
MGQDIVADALNQIMNAKRAGKRNLEIKRSSNLFENLLEMMKEGGYIDFEKKERVVAINILKLNECRAIKPRYYVGIDEIEKYLRRFLPSRKLGKLVISTSKGLLTHNEAETKNVGGSLIAFYY